MGVGGAFFSVLLGFLPDLAVVFFWLVAAFLVASAVADFLGFAISLFALGFLLALILDFEVFEKAVALISVFSATSYSDIALADFGFLPVLFLGFFVAVAAAFIDFSDTTSTGAAISAVFSKKLFAVYVFFLPLGIKNFLYMF